MGQEKDTSVALLATEVAAKLCLLLAVVLHGSRDEPGLADSHFLSLRAGHRLCPLPPLFLLADYDYSLTLGIA